MRMSSAAAAAQAGGASMTTAETMHAFKHAMAHSLGPAPAPSAARPGSKRIAQRRALAETSSGLNVRADVAPSPVKLPGVETALTGRSVHDIDTAFDALGFSDERKAVIEAFLEIYCRYRGQSLASAAHEVFISIIRA